MLLTARMVAASGVPAVSWEIALEAGAEAYIATDPRSVEIVPRFLIRDLFLEWTAHQLLREIAESPGYSRLVAEAIAQEAAGHLIAAHPNLAKRPRSRRYAMAPARLKRPQEFMRANLGRTLSLKEIAEAAGMSLFHFARGVREATGRPPHQFLLEQRLYRARALLHDPRLTVGDIARTVGLTHSHFTAVLIDSGYLEHAR